MARAVPKNEDLSEFLVLHLSRDTRQGAVSKLIAVAVFKCLKISG